MGREKSKSRLSSLSLLSWWLFALRVSYSCHLSCGSLGSSFQIFKLNHVHANLPAGRQGRLGRQGREDAQRNRQFVKSTNVKSPSSPVSFSLPCPFALPLSPSFAPVQETACRCKGPGSLLTIPEPQRGITAHCLRLCLPILGKVVAPFASASACASALTPSPCPSVAFSVSCFS
jgi:hypothetical protein